MTSRILTSILLAATVCTFSIGGVASGASAQQQTSITDLASKEAPPSFATPEAAVAAFKATLAAKDVDGLATLLGLDPMRAKATDGATETVELIAEGARKSLIVREVDGSKILVIGEKLWPMPFPISKQDDGKWFFDTFAGLEEIVARRVGENELATIVTMLEYADAQAAYEAEDHDGDGVREYAQKLISTEGEQDGLAWQNEQGDTDEDSPAGAALAEAEFTKAKAGDGYFGYRYRILTGQGANIAGGQFSYIINGNMIAGFGLVAWPVKYGETGVHTFVINKEGTAYQADLGADTEKLASDIRTFNPGESWEVVE